MSADFDVEANLEQGSGDTEATDWSSYPVLDSGDYEFEIFYCQLQTSRRNEQSKYYSVGIRAVDWPETQAVWLHFTFENPNVRAVEIGRSQLATLCKSGGLTGKIDPELDLIGSSFFGTLKVDPEGFNGRPSYEMVRYFGKDNAPSTLRKPEASASSSSDSAKRAETTTEKASNVIYVDSDNPSDDDIEDDIPF